MADVQFGKNEFNGLLAMLTHEGANGIVKLLNAGKTEDAFRYTAGLMDTWTNRAAGSGRSLLSEMSRPGQITDWAPDQSVINQKASSLDSRIRDMAAAYMNDRVNGADALFPKTNFYLNKDLVDYFHTVDPQKYSTKYHNWYDGANDVQAYGFRGKDGNGGRNSTETQFVANGNERKVPDDYSLVSRGDLNLKPTEAAQQAYFQARGRQAISLDQQNAINAGLGHVDVSEGLGFPGYAVSPDGKTAYYEMPDTDGAQKRPVGTDVLASIGNGLTSGLDTARNAIGQAYSDTLNRLPTAEELQSRLDGITSGASNLYDQIAGIAGSAEAKEAQQQTGFDPMRYVADQTYREMLGRGASDTDITSALGVLQNGGGLGSIAANLAGSQEGQTYQIGNFYQNAFGRQADSPGLQNALAQLQSGKSLQAVEAQLLASPEAQAQGITPDQFAKFLTPSYTAQPEGAGTSTGTLGFNGTTAGMQGPGATTTGEQTGTDAGLLGPCATATGQNTGTEVGAQGPGTTSTSLNTGTQVGTQGPTAGETTTAWNGVFDPSAHRAANADVAASGMDPLTHYLTYGFKEGRALDTQGDHINQGFDPSAYLKANSDVAAAGMNPLQHYLQFGAHEGRAADFSGGVSPGSFGTGITPNGPTQVTALPPQSLAEMITAAYQADLQRAPDAAGLQAAFDGISSGRETFDQFQARMAESPEAQAAHGHGINVPMLDTATPVGMQGPAAGEATTAFNGRFDGNAYKAANPDVAASGMDPLTHYLTYGYNEGRTLDAAGDRINKGFDASAYLRANPDVAAAHQDALSHYILNGAFEGRALPTGGNPYSFSGANVSQGAGPTGSGSFNGRFDASQYLAANPDVAAAHVDPLTHYLTHGFSEGRAIDTAGDRINRAFDPTQYLTANPDVAAAHMDPLQHYLQNGAAEGRALPTGSNPYSFSNASVAQGAGATGNGAFGLGGVTSSGGMGSSPAAPTLPSMGAGFNVSGGVQNGSFGVGGITMGSPTSAGSGGISNPFGFSSANVGGGLGATTQSFGSLFPAGNNQPASNAIDPYSFSSANVAGYNPNSAGGGSTQTASNPNDWGSGAGLGDTTWATPENPTGFNAQASELAFLRGQMAQQLTRDQASLNSGATAASLVNMGNQSAANLNAVGAGNAAKQFAGIQAGLGITPVFASSLYTPPPMNFGPIGPVLPPMMGFL